MSEVKRYSFWPQIVHLPGGGGVRAEVHFKVEEDGLFVAHQDYAELKAENEELHKDYEAIADEHTKLTNRKLLEENARLKDELTDRKAEADRLKAEVERLKANSGLDQKTIRNLQQTPEWSEIARLTADYRALEAENERLRASSFVTAVPVEQYERVVKAGDAFVVLLRGEGYQVDQDPEDGDEGLPEVVAWNAAKEGKPSA